MIREPRHGQGRLGRQRGAALVGALIFLMILTVLGSTSVVNTMLQERMAGNARNRDLAFQAAEHALDDANAWLMAQTKDTMGVAPGVVVLDSGGGIHANDTAYWRNGFDWASDDLREPGGTDLGFVAGQPRYVIERLPPVADCDPVTLGNQPCDYYRVTARGLGGTGETAVILQTLYQFE